MVNQSRKSDVTYDPIMTPIFILIELSILGATVLITIGGIYYSFINPSF